jgi:hypothetical protein
VGKTGKGHIDPAYVFKPKEDKPKDKPKIGGHRLNPKPNPKKKGKK